MKKLYRSRQNRVFAGIAGGLGEYFEIDPVVIRLIWLVLIFLWGTGLVAYLIAWLIIPKEPKAGNVSPVTISTSSPNHRGKVFFGILFILLGLILIARQDWELWWRIKEYVRDFVHYVVPAGLILIGIYLMVPRRSSTKSPDVEKPTDDVNLE